MFYQPALIVATDSKVDNFEGIPISFYSLERWVKIFQVLEAEAHQTSILSPEGIMRAKGEGIKALKQPVPLIYTAPEDLSINKEGATMEWMCKWHQRDLQ